MPDTRPVAGYPRPDRDNNPTHNPMALASRDSRVFAPQPAPIKPPVKKGAKKRAKKKK